jgi:undecaprenyl-diphosphatase
VSGLTYVEAVVVGAFQGITELFPVSSLGHSVLVPALIGGRWTEDLSVSAPESPYLAFIVGLHVATAAALLVFFWRDWLRILSGFATSLRYRRIQTPAERLAWLIVLRTIPVGLSGLALEHLFRTTLGKPVPSAEFLMVNGVVLFAGERLRRRVPAPVGAPGLDPGLHAIDEGPGELDESDRRLARMPMARGVLIGSAQIHALLPGISRSSITMVAGLMRSLNYDDAARFSFLLATPVILGRRRVQDSHSVRTAGRRDPWPGSRRQHRLVCQCLFRGAVPHPVLPHPHAHALRHLLRCGRCGKSRLAGHPVRGCKLRLTVDNRSDRFDQERISACPTSNTAFARCPAATRTNSFASRRHSNCYST